MATGNIIVIEPEDGFKRIHKSIIRNKNIDCLTLGIYTKITVLGAEWQLNVKGLSSALNLSDTKIRKSLGILEKEGYIVRKPIRGDKGQMQGWDYIVFPTPIDEKERSKAGYPKIPFDEQEQFVAENEPNRLPQKPTTRLTDNTESWEDYNNRPNITIDLNNNKTNKEKKEIQKKKKGYTQEFEEAWKLYNRKGGKQEAFKRWCALTDKEKELALAHIPFYIQSNDIQFLKDFEGYLNKKYFLRVVRDKKGNTLYDPDQQTDSTYHPITGGSLNWNDYYKCFLYTGWYFDGDSIADGYDDDKRPDGAQIVLNNGRGTLTWNKEQQKWVKS